VRDEVVAANERFAAAFAFGDLPRRPSRGFAVVTCLDARIDPYQMLGLKAGEANVIRNAGGVVSDDVLRSLAISHALLGTREALVIGHTDCGMLTFTNEEMRARLHEEGLDAGEVDFLPFSDLDAGVRDSVERVRASRLLPDSFGAAGFVYDVRTGRLRKVA
jgi:carbonic anhydrase